MKESDNGLSEAPAKSQLRKSLASRFNALIGSKSAHINDFFVELDAPHKQYGPGDTVAGKVILNVARPLGVTHIVVCLYGFVEVFKGHSKSKSLSRRNAARSSAGRGSKRWVSEYYGDGYASLFEEELVLCGEGRLDPSLYHFRFELDFPTTVNLPSSIDFERGTVAYAITSTITRPTSLTPTTSCDCTVSFKDNIDVGLIPTPKPRIVTLEPVDRNSKSRHNIKRLTGERKRFSSVSPTSTMIPSTPDRASTLAQEIRSPRPTSPSAASSVSISSSARQDPILGAEIQSSSHSQQSLSISTIPESMGDRIITTTIELTKGGCLPGEVIPLKINIRHTKAVRSLNGIIATLYREARTDMHPNIPLGPAGAINTSSRYEDYYPRSRTGLGGLSLSSAGSSHKWRKDMSQTLAPLYIDPRTMTAELKLMIRVPDDAFPSIRNSPGEMISFRYRVEVIIDIHGKLAQQERAFPNFNMTSQQLGHGAGIGRPDDANEHMVTAWGLNCVNTIELRRAANAITIETDLIVGTRDTKKAAGKRREESVPRETGAEFETNCWPGQEWSGDGFYDEGYENGDYYDYDGYDYGYGYHHHDPSWRSYPAQAGAQEQLPPVPLPSMPEEEDLPEKERLRRAEAALLPSAPPGTDDSREVMPSAPFIPEESYELNRYRVGEDRQPNGLDPAEAAGPSDPDRGELSRTNGIPENVAAEAERQLSIPSVSEDEAGNALGVTTNGASVATRAAAEPRADGRVESPTTDTLPQYQR